MKFTQVLTLSLVLSSAAHAQDLFKYLPPELQEETLVPDETFVEKKKPRVEGLDMEKFGDLESWLNKDLYLAAGYQQQHYQLKDIQGDVALVSFARTNMKRIKLMIKKDHEGIRELVALQQDGFERYKSVYKQWTFNQLDDQPLDFTLTEERIAQLHVSEESKDLLREHALGTELGFELRSKPFHAKNVVNMMMQVIVEEREKGIEPKIGTEHVFSEEMYKYYKKEFPVLRTGMSKIFMALGNGLTFRFMITEKEEALAHLIEAEPAESVTLEKAFRLSYQLNDGDVYLTLLTLENLFAYHWNNPQRDRVSVLQRLKPFTHYFNKGDKFGHWYHFWGMVLYGHLRGSFRAGLVGGIEEVLSRLAGGEAEQENQEGKVNIYGGIAGGKLRKMLDKKSYLKFKADPTYLQETYYLEPMKLDEAIKKRFKAPKKQSKKHFHKSHLH